MEEEWEIGEDEWVVGELIAPGGEGESPPLSDRATGAISISPMEGELEIGEEERPIGELEAPIRQEELPPLLDQPTTPPPPPGSSLAQGHATAAAALIRNKRGRAPASGKAIQGLREVTAPLTDDCCAICLQDFDSRPDPADLRRLRAMPCSHTFHEHCIFEWLRRNAACPLCRHQLPTEEEDQGRSSRRLRTRLLYDPEDGQFHVLWCMSSSELAFAGDEEQEVDPELQAYFF